jgi:diketogulonate reductase-like aldo/keto reductase
MASNQKFTGNKDSVYNLNSGYTIPVLGFGVYQTPADVASEVVQHAIKVGYRQIDSAVAYRNEADSADGMKKSGLARGDLFFTTKIPPKEMNYENAKRHIDNSLKVTGFDYIDLYILHSPYGGKENRIGAWKALVEGVEAGKIRSIGVSNYGVHHLEELEQWIKSTEEKEGKGKGGVLRASTRSSFILGFRGKISLNGVKRGMSYFKLTLPWSERPRRKTLCSFR